MFLGGSLNPLHPTFTRADRNRPEFLDRQKSINPDAKRESHSNAFP
jgi:hypothetical protein